MARAGISGFAVVYRQHHLWFSVRTRNISGYKINEENYPSNKLPENSSHEDKFQKKVNIATLKRRRSPLSGLQKVTFHDVLKQKELPEPNMKYRNQEDAVKYRSFDRYYKAAENERRRQHREGVWWKNLDYWLKEHRKHLDMVDIGKDLPRNQVQISSQCKSEPKDKKLLEKQARERTLILDVEEINNQWEKSPTGIQGIKRIADHYNIFKDLYIDKFFYPVVPMDICFPYGDVENPVYYGNELLVSEIEGVPTVEFTPNKDKLYALILTNLDGHLEDNEKEYLHWFVGNIPNSDVSKGDVLVDFLPPFPARGTGYHRLVFVLYEQNERINFDSEKRDIPCTSLRQRDFKSAQFLKLFCNELVPVSLRFFQCKWDPTVRMIFHQTLCMPEPVYQYHKFCEKPKLSTLTKYPSGKSMLWMSRFMPQEMVYPDASHESKSLRRDAAVDASAARRRKGRRPYPVQNVY